MVRRRRCNVGLSNLGATCYMNAVVQALGNCEGFVTHLKRAASNNPGACVARALLHVYTAQSESLRESKERNTVTASYVDTRKLVRVVEQVIPGWSSANEQHDAQEFAMALVDRLMTEAKGDWRPDVGSTDGPVADLSRADAIMPHPPSEGSIKIAGQADAHWRRSLPPESPASGLAELFYGQYVSQVTCGACRRMTHSFDCMMGLPLDIRANTIEGCMDAFFEDELLDDWKCEACGKKSPDSRKVARCWRLPRVMLVMVKRFSPVDGRKLEHPLRANSVIDMGDYLACFCAEDENDENEADAEADRPYQLASAVCHGGRSMASGHYRAFCRTATDIWVECDDEDTRVTTAADSYRISPVLRPPPEREAYLLAYQTGRSVAERSGAGRSGAHHADTETDDTIEAVQSWPTANQLGAGSMNAVQNWLMEHSPNKAVEDVRKGG